VHTQPGAAGVGRHGMREGFELLSHDGDRRLARLECDHGVVDGPGGAGASIAQADDDRLLVAHEVLELGQGRVGRLTRSLASTPVADVCAALCEQPAPFVAHPFEGAPGGVVANAEMTPIQERECGPGIGVDFRRTGRGIEYEDSRQIRSPCVTARPVHRVGLHAGTRVYAISGSCGDPTWYGRGMAETSALSGLKVLDLANLLAAPQIATTLADFGADVVKIEPRSGDPLRRIGAQRNGASPQWSLVSRNKRAITLDLDHSEGQSVFRQLVERADVLVENLTPSLLERWHCGYEELARHNRRLVVVSVSCYGRSGPYQGRPGAGTLAEAFAGFAHMNGEAEGPPMLPSLPLGDILCGFSGVIGTLMALYARDREVGGSGRGQHVDVTMVEPILQLLALPLAIHDGRGPGPKRIGSRVAGAVPRNLYRCSDQHWMALSGTTDAQVARVLAVIGRDSAEDFERFGSSEARLRVADELDALVAAWIAPRPREEVLESFHAARIPVAPVNDLGALLDDPHLRERASVVTLDDPEIGEMFFVAPTPRLSATPGRHRHTGPPLGEHNVEVYAEWLGMNAEQVAALSRDGAI